jgi:heat shock protein HslJ
MMTRRLGFAALIVALAQMSLIASEEARAQGIGYGVKPKPVAPADPQQLEGPAAGKQDKTFPLGASWTVISLNGKPISDRRITLQVDQNLRGTGFGGCNTFSASAYPLRQQGFAVGPLALTKRSCDKSVLDFERSYLTALRGARNWDLVSGKLVIKGAAGEIQFDRGI